MSRRIEKRGIVEVKMTEMKENKEFPFTVTYVDCDGPLLQIHGHTDRKSVVQMEEMLTTIVNRLDNSNTTKHPTLTPQMLCCVKFHEKRYYRARLCSPLNNGCVLVQLIDYGNVENVKFENVRFLADKPEAHILQMPVLLKTYVLAGAAPVETTWTPEKVQYIKKTLIGNEVTVRQFFQIDHRFMVHMKYQGCDLAAGLVDRDVAKYVAPDEMASFRVLKSKSGVRNMPHPVQPRNPTSIDYQYGQNESLTMPIMPSLKPPAEPASSTNVFKSRVLEVGQTYDVYVSFVEDGPKIFSVQLAETKEMLSYLMQEINSNPVEPLGEPPLPGSTCLGRYSCEGVLCRAVIVNVAGTKCKVYYVDFGHTEVLPFSEIFQLPSKYNRPRVLSTRINLSGIKNWDITKDVKQFFKNYVANKKLKLKVCPPEKTPLIQFGTLYDKEKDIKDILLEQFPNIRRATTYEEPPRLQVGERRSVRVAYIESCESFFVHLEEDLDALDKLMSHISVMAASLSPLKPDQMTEGTPCLALYEMDQQWYRAQITSVKNDLIKVNYVDYGNEELVGSNALKTITEDLVTVLKCQAIKCTLKGFQGRSVDPKLSVKFEQMVMIQSMIMSVEQRLINSYIVDLLENQTLQSVALQLKGETATETPPVNASQNDKNYDCRRSDTNSPDWRQNSNRNDYSKAPNKPQDDRAPAERKNWKDSDNEKKCDKMKKALAPSTPEPKNLGGKERGFRDSSRDDRFTRKEAYSTNDYDEENTFRSGRDFRTTKFGGGSSRPCDNLPTDRMNNREFDANQRIATSPSNDQRLNCNTRDNRTLEQDFSVTANEITQPRIVSSPAQNKYLPLPYKPISVELKSTHSCEITFVENLGEFYFVLNSEKKTLDTITKKIKERYTTGGNYLAKSDAKPNVPCVAQYADDQLWYRAIIKRLDGPNAHIEFVDYGNKETVPTDQLKEITPDIAKYPAQALPCNMFRVPEDSWSAEFVEIMQNGTFPVEFISFENNFYQVLIKVPGSKQYVNDVFAPGVNFENARDQLYNKSAPQSNVVEKEKSAASLTPLDSHWKEPEVETDSNGLYGNVIVTWFVNPFNFYCQKDSSPEFRSMMDEIQKMYSSAQPIASASLKVNSSVIAIFSEDRVYYRAKITKLNSSPGKHLVQYVDYGNQDEVQPKHIFPINAQFTKLPKQAIECRLKGIFPLDGKSWTNVRAIEQVLLQVSSFECIVHDVVPVKGKYEVSLNAKGKSLADILVNKGLAKYEKAPEVTTPKVSETITAAPSAAISSATVPSVQQTESLQFDLSLLVNQTLLVVASNVQGVDKFHIQLPTAEMCQNSIATYMAKKDSQMLALPSELVAMQNQAIECCLMDENPSSESNQKLKKLIENKPVIIKVEDLKNNRLSVQLFDTTGSKITLDQTTSSDRTCPICPLPILKRSEKIVISAVNEEGLWFQKFNDIENITALLSRLYEFYSNQGQILRAPKVDCLCAALSADGNWYRAKITQAEGKVRVHYIDYGNDETIGAESIKILEPQFHVPHAFCMNLPLSNLDQTISKATINSILQQLGLEEASYMATFYNSNKSWSVDLESEGNKLSDHVKICLAQISKVPAKKNKQPPAALTGADEYVPNQTYDVKVSFVNDPHDIWLQKAEHSDNLLDFQEKLQSLAKSAKEIKEVPELGSLCLAKYMIDDCWYRAEVLDADTLITSVRFIDYGNVDVIEPDNFCIRELPAKVDVSKVGKFARKSQLNILPPKGEVEWSKDVCDRLHILVESYNVKASVISANPTGPIKVDLIVDEKDLGKQLLLDNLALPPTAEPESASFEQEPEKEMERILDPRSAFFSDGTGPNDFSVQMDKDVPNLEFIDNRLLVGDMQDPITKIIEGMWCIAKYPEDKMWYRAKVLEVTKTGARVCYLDYGNCGEATQLSILPDDIAAYPMMARKCSLYHPHGRLWPEETKSTFLNLCQRGLTVFLLDVVEEKDDTLIVKLTFNGKDVSEMLLGVCKETDESHEQTNGVKESSESSVAEDADGRLPPLGEEDLPRYAICHIETLTEFYMHAEKDNDEINKINKVMESVEYFEEVKNPKVGSIYAAKYEGSWYRAEVTKVEGEKVSVYFIDFGNSCETEDKMKILSKDVLRIRPLAVRCSLKLPKSVTEWSEKALDKFWELADYGLTMFTVKFRNDDDGVIRETMDVTLLLDGKDVAEILEPLCPKKIVCITLEDTIVESDKELDNTLDLNDFEVSNEITVCEIINNMEPDYDRGSQESAETSLEDSSAEDTSYDELNNRVSKSPGLDDIIETSREDSTVDETNETRQEDGLELEGEAQADLSSSSKISSEGSTGPADVSKDASPPPLPQPEIKVIEATEQ